MNLVSIFRCSSPPPDQDIVSAYAKLVSENFYISINTVPEIMYALSALNQFMTRETSQHYGYS